MKIAIIGAGSTYTPELIEGIIERKANLPLKELYLMDIDDRKLDIVGKLCQRMIENAKIKADVVLTKDLEATLKNADFVLCQIRVGKLPARVLDEKIPLKHDLIGQETCGIGGFFKGLRTIPVMLEICRKMEVLCPDAWLINFSNPSGILAEMILNHTKVKMLGLCNVPINTVDGLKKRLNLPNAFVEYMGLNHLAYITAVRDNGKDYLFDAINAGINSESMKNIPTSGFPAEAIKTIGAIPTSYLEYYYYKDSKLEKLKTAEKTRGELCIDIEAQLLDIYQNLDLNDKPKELSKRGGSRYSEAAISLVDAIWNDKNEHHIVNCLNNGALDFLKDTDSIEIGAIINKKGATPIKVENFNNKHVKDYISMVKAYENHTVNAAIKGCDHEAMRALMINPLVLDYNKALACYNELKEAHKEYLPQFFGAKK